jgi:hypothetical protein
MPHISISPMFAKDISWICRSRDMCYVDNASCDGLTHTVIGQHSVPLVEFRMDLRGTVDHGLVVPKHVASITERDSKITS